MSEKELAEFEKWLETAGDEIPAIDVWPDLITNDTGTEQNGFDEAEEYEMAEAMPEGQGAGPDPAGGAASAGEGEEIVRVVTRTALRSEEDRFAGRQQERRAAEASTIVMEEIGPERDKKDTLILDRRSFAKQAASAAPDADAAGLADPLPAEMTGRTAAAGATTAAGITGAAGTAKAAEAAEEAEAGTAGSRRSRGRSRKKRSRGLLRGASMVLIIQAIFELILAGQLIRMDILPDRYLYAAIGLLIVLFLIPVLLLRFRRLRISITRILSALLIMAMIIPVTAGSSYALMKASDTIRAVSGAGHDAKSVTEEVFTVYLSGSDTRSSTLDSSRSDVNILLVADPVKKQILLVNTPRDYYIANPAAGGEKDKLAHCALYGTDNSLNALEDLYSTEVDYSAQINFTGFETLIDALGGLTVYSDRTFTSQGCTFIKGENQMNGREALIFARDRENQEDGDNDRGLHQMAVVKAMIEKMSSKRALLTGYGEMLDSLKGMFSTDMSAGSLSDLIKMQLDDMASWNIIPYAVIGENASDTTYSMPGTRLSVMYPDADSVARASELIAKMKEGGNLSAAGLLPADSASGDTAQGNAA